MKKAYKRFYTKKSHKLMSKVRLSILVIMSPLWLPLQLIIEIGYQLEDLLHFLDGLLQKILDKIIPQIK